jgi:Spy/CpxP family protein refolding chaperone
MKTKAILVVVATLLIGFMLGMLTSAQIRHTKLKKMRTSVSGKDFAEMMMNAINPDVSQRAQLEKVMQDYEKATREMQLQFRQDFDSVSTAFKKDIDTLLTADQLARVREMEKRNSELMKRMNRRRDWHSDDRGKHSPGPAQRNDSLPRHDQR